MSTLLGQGLVITVIGMGLVFAALGLLWLLITLLGRVSRADTHAAAAGTGDASARWTRAFRRFLPSRGEPAKASSPDRGLGAFGAEPAAGRAEARVGEGVEPDTAEREALSAERAQVAALVAGALMANALPLLLEVPAGPTFEHGRTAPIWVSANRARTLYSWQPRRSPEVSAIE